MSVYKSSPIRKKLAAFFKLPRISKNSIAQQFLNPNILRTGFSLFFNFLIQACFYSWIQIQLDEVTEAWGIKVERVEM